jgi:flagellar basal-body rod modification protein FlgD
MPTSTQQVTEPSPLDALHVSNSQASAPKEDGKVDRDSFLNLLVTQLRHQDPLDPVGNTEFISQLAQFQSLESQTAMGKSIEDLVHLQESQLALAGLSQAALLVGKHVTWIDEKGKAGEGTVNSVTVEQGVMMINTENGKIPVAALTSIALGPPAGGNGGSGSEPPSNNGNAGGATTPPPPSLTTTGAITPPTLSHHA